MGIERGKEWRRKGWLLPLFLGTALLVQAFTAPPPPLPTAPPSLGGPPRVMPVDLPGAGGPRHLPTGEPTVVHVWLKDCPDCAPAFEAAKRLGVGPGRWGGAPVVNVSAYGAVDPGWAAEAGLGDGLVADAGGNVVSLLTYKTFSTLVLDANGCVRAELYPQHDDYAERVQAALKAAATPLPLPPALAPALPAADLPLLSIAGWSLVALGLLWGASAIPWRLLLSLLRPVAAPRRALGQELALQDGQRCPYCHADLNDWDWVVRCEGCATAYHEECATDLGRCSSLGCRRPVAGRRARST